MDNAPNSFEPAVFLRDLAHRIWQIPTHFGVDGGEVDALNDIAKTLAPKPADSQLVDALKRDQQAIGAAISRRCWQSCESAYNKLRDRIDAALSRHQSPADAERDSELESYEKFDGIGPHDETIETRARIGEQYLEAYASALDDPRLKGYTPADCPSGLLLYMLNLWAPETDAERDRIVAWLREHAEEWKKHHQPQAAMALFAEASRIASGAHREAGE